MASQKRLSGMQKQVLGLYRGFLRAARLKSSEERSRIESIVSAEFRHNAKNVDRKNTLYIEYLMRRAKKQLDQLSGPAIVGLSTIKLASSATTDKSSAESAESHGDNSTVNHGAITGAASS